MRRVPVVARGAGTGLLAGALPLKNGILLVMARFNRVIVIDIDIDIDTRGSRSSTSTPGRRRDLNCPQRALHRSVRAQRIFLRLL